MLHHSLVRFTFGASLAAVLAGTLARPSSAAGGPIVNISDKYPVTQTLPPGFVGPPGDDYANVTYSDTNGVSSWRTEVFTWQPGYVPTSSTDTGGIEVTTLIDSGNGDNDVKTKQVRPYDYIYMYYRQAGTAYFCFHTSAIGKYGPFAGITYNQYTGAEFLQFQGH